MEQPEDSWTTNYVKTKRIESRHQIHVTKTNQLVSTVSVTNNDDVFHPSYHTSEYNNSHGLPLTVSNYVQLKHITDVLNDQNQQLENFLYDERQEIVCSDTLNFRDGEFKKKYTSFILSKFFRHWKVQYKLAHKKNIAVIHYKINLISDNFNEWRIFTVQSRVFKRMSGVARICYEDKICKDMFNRWKSMFLIKCMKLRKQREKLNHEQQKKLAQQKYDFMLIKTTFLKWQYQKKLKKALYIHNQLQLRKCFKLWNLKMWRRCLQRRLARALYKKKLKAHIFNIWKTTLQQQKIELKNRLANNQIKNQRFHFKKWKVYVVRCKGMRANFNVLEGIAHCNSKRFYLHQWKKKLALKQFQNKHVIWQKDYSIRNCAKTWRHNIKKKKLLILLNDWQSRKINLLLKSCFQLWLQKKDIQQNLFEQLTNQISFEKNILFKYLNKWRQTTQHILLKKTFHEKFKKAFLLRFFNHWYDMHSTKLQCKECLKKKENDLMLKILKKWRYKTEKKNKFYVELPILQKTVKAWKDYCSYTKARRDARITYYAQHWLDITQQRFLDKKIKLAKKASNKVCLKVYFIKWLHKMQKVKSKELEGELKADCYLSKSILVNCFNLWVRQWNNGVVSREYLLQKEHVLLENVFKAWQLYAKNEIEKENIKFCCRINEINRSSDISQTVNYKSSFNEDTDFESGVQHVSKNESLPSHRKTYSSNEVTESSLDSLTLQLSNQYLPVNESKKEFLVHSLNHWKFNSIIKVFYLWLEYSQNRKYQLKLQKHLIERNEMCTKRKLFLVWNQKLFCKKVAEDHHKKFLYRSMFAKLKEYCQKQSKQRRSIVAKHHYRRTIFMNTFKAWRKKLVYPNQCCIKLSEHQTPVAEVQFLKLYFLKWRTNHFQNDIALSHYEGVVKSKCLSSWRWWLSKSERRKLKVHQLQTKFLLKKFYFNWQKQLENKNSLFRQKQLERMLMANVFKKWYQWSCEEYDNRNKSMMFIKKTEIILLVKTINIWKIETMKIKKADDLYQDLIKKRLFSCWQLYLKRLYIHRQSVVLIKNKQCTELSSPHEFLSSRHAIILRVGNLLNPVVEASRSFVYWRKAYERKRKTTTQENQCEKISVSSAFNCWKNYARIVRSQSYYRNNNLRKYLWLWRKGYMTTKREKELQMKVAARWIAFIKRRRMDKESCNVFLDATSTLLLFNCFNFWKNASQQSRIAREKYSANMLKRALVTWCGHIKTVRYRQQNHDYLLLKKAHELLLNYFSTWKQRNAATIKNKQDNETVNQMAVQHYHNKLRKNSFKFWNSLWQCEKFRIMRENFLMKKYSRKWYHSVLNEKIAVNIYKGNLYEKYWTRWRLAYVKKLVVNQMGQADERKLLSKVFINWSCYTKRKRKLIPDNPRF